MDYKYGFGMVRKGYNPEEVDKYIDETLARMTAMQEQNAALFAKLTEAQDMIRRYSETEKSLRHSIAESKRAAADMLDVARVRSANLVNSAREECNRIVDELDRQIEAKYKTIDNIKNNVADFKNKLFTLYSSHIEMVDTLAATADEFEYDPDFTALSEAIEEFEAEGAPIAPEAPDFPEMPEEGFFSEGAEPAAEPLSAPDEPDAGDLTFGFEEPGETEVPAGKAETEIEDESAEEELFFEAPEAKEEEPTETASDEDEMFSREDSDEQLFSFLKDFVNGSEE